MKPAAPHQFVKNAHRHAYPQEVLVARSFRFAGAGSPGALSCDVCCCVQPVIMRYSRFDVSVDDIGPDRRRSNRAGRSRPIYAPLVDSDVWHCCAIPAFGGDSEVPRRSLLDRRVRRETNESHRQSSSTCSGRTRLSCTARRSSSPRSVSETPSVDPRRRTPARVGSAADRRGHPVARSCPVAHRRVPNAFILERPIA